MGTGKSDGKSGDKSVAKTETRAREAVMCKKVATQPAARRLAERTKGWGKLREGSKRGGTKKQGKGG